MIVSYLTRKVCLFAILLAIVLIMPVSAAVRVTDTVKYMEGVSPGSTITFPITLTAGSTDKAENYTINVVGFGNGQGSYVAVDPEFDTSPQTARPYLTVSKNIVRLDPGKSETVTATVSVPATATGGLYALINIYQAGQTGMVRTAINVPVMVTVKGTTIRETGVIDAVTLSGSNINPSSVTTTFTNTGNHHYYGVKDLIIVYDKNGGEMNRNTTTPLVTAIVPGGKVNLTQKVNTKELQNGNYTLNSYVLNERDEVLNTKIVPFTITGVSVVSQEVPTTEPTEESPGFGEILTIIGIIAAIAIISSKR